MKYLFHQYFETYQPVIEVINMFHKKAGRYQLSQYNILSRRDIKRIVFFVNKLQYFVLEILISLEKLLLQQYVIISIF